MKKVIVSVFSALFLFAGVAVADEKDVKVEDVKQHILQTIDKTLEAEKQLRDKQLAIVGQFRSCIQAGKSMEDFNACNNAKNESLNKLRLEVEKSNLESQKKAIVNEEKRINEEMKK